MVRPRSVPRDGDLFVTVCPKCNTERLLKNNPGRRRDTVCTSCLRTGRATTPATEVSPEIVDRYVAGESAARLAAELGIWPGTMLRALRRASVECRTMSDAIRLLDNTGRLRGSLDMLRETGELSKRLSAGHQRVDVEGWEDFRSDMWARIRSGSDWKGWREKVYARDSYRCVLCARESTRANPLEPHHIWKKSAYPDRMFDVVNGVTLCRECHREVTGQEDDWIAAFEAIVTSRATA